MSKPNEQVEQNNEQVEQEEESLDLDVKRVKSLQTNVKGGNGSAWSSQTCAEF